MTKTEILQEWRLLARCHPRYLQNRQRRPVLHVALLRFLTDNIFFSQTLLTCSVALEGAWLKVCQLRDFYMQQ